MSRGSVRDDVPAAVRAFLETEGIGTGTPVLAAFSGGADSTAMLLALQALGVPVTAAHVHHGLRGAEADRDAAFCGDLCAICDQRIVYLDLLAVKICICTRPCGKCVDLLMDCKS